VLSRIQKRTVFQKDKNDVLARLMDAGKQFYAIIQAENGRQLAKGGDKSDAQGSGAPLLVFAINERAFVRVEHRK